ncbi:beta-galactosidase [Nonomuraea jabiensis]|uniref:beta-galactosidase n=1 Tax=Nonomuraea jabiensis TaxID=882448 RepID=UPI00369D699C
MRRLLAVFLVLLCVLLGAPAGAGATAHEVTYDRYSLKVDGERLVLQSAEFHYFRLPSPELWRDVLEKLRAAGFNAVSIYFSWAYHSPKPGVYDFTGVRDVDRLLRTARQAGLYVIARPGPYINAESTGGGDIGPQRDFVLPAGLLDEHGSNTIALAVTAEQPVAGPGPISLFTYGNVRTTR